MPRTVTRPGTAVVPSNTTGPTPKPPKPATTTPKTPKTTDIYNRKPVELKKPAALAGPKNLGDVGGVNVVIGQDGTLGLGQVPAGLSEQMRAARIIVSKAPNSQPLSGVTDVNTLRSIAWSAAKMYDAALRTPKNDAEMLELRAGRASALALMEAAARQAGVLGDKEARDQLTLGLMFSIGKEPFRPLKAFAYESSLVRADKGELSKTKTAETALYPQQPPYEKWLKDGVIKVMHYTDNNGSPTADNIALYTERGFKKKSNPDGSTTLVRAAKDGKPRIEVTIPKPPTHDTPPSLFEKMGDPSVDMIIYAGHAGYGKRVEDALAKGVSGTGDGKLVMLMQCYGEGSIESVNRTFPDAQLISTREASDDNYDFTLMNHVLDGIDKKADYKAVEKGVNREFSAWVASLKKDPQGFDASDVQSYVDHPIETHYFYPNTRDVILNKMDRDRDGVRDGDDQVFNIVYPKRMDASGGYDPLDSGTPLDALDGTALNSATGQLNLFARYAELPANLIKNVPWNPEVFQPGGFFEGSSNALNAFKFETDAASGKVKVLLNSQFAHAPASALSRMMAIEAGAYIAKQSNLDAAKTAALQLAMLERMVHQEGTSWSSTKLDEMKNELLKRRYQLPISVADLQTVSGNPDDFVAATFSTLEAKVRTSNYSNLGATPQRATTAVTVPPNVVLSGYIDSSGAQELARRFGIQGTVDSANFGWGHYASASEAIEFPMVDASGKKFLFSLGLDADGVVRAASTIPQ